ncbi:putative FAD-linked oxidoreductase YgaK [Halomicronema hongdechloris C2206]|uniref:FAD-linked oxidoreductase YgaK n=1 Tax=Halomicronema hongdechloris C2206 TaxID=1641165 RepID=A0A1Z3HIL1_9CYAN|nr:FAD-binding oxidoreductase [Halomicronema hongdechloris]ASC70135.1 putative FAD-linked oxidoreductase YgaK [Halomicronema hongdechloris C2206]
MLSTSTLEQFADTLRGQLIQPEDAGYNEARTIYNAMIDKRPRFIAQCANVADVIAAVKFGQAYQLDTAIRGGGHSGPGLGICDDGLVIDLSFMRGIRIDPATRTARVEGGCRWGDVDHATHAFGLATVSGINSNTGVGGLTLGGGHGHLTRKYGLTIDNLLEVDIVLADGHLVTANASQHPDLFWAVRGGGGNFGVITSFLFQLHPVSTVYAGPTLWPLDQAEAVMKWYRDFLPAAPEDLSGFFMFLQVPPAPPFPEHLHFQTMCGVFWCYVGAENQLKKVFEPVQAVGSPALHAIHPMPYPALQSAFDELYPPGHQWYWKGDFVKDLSDDAIARHVQHGSQVPTLRSTMHLYPIDGAAHNVGKNDTAFSYRDATWSEVIVGVSPEPAHNDQLRQWTRDYWEATHPYSLGGAYVNFLMEEGGDRIKATYRDNYDRLVEIKTQYDPTNLFSRNQNIQPST